MTDSDEIDFRGLYCEWCEEMITEGKDYARFLVHVAEEHSAPKAVSAVKLKNGEVVRV